MAHVYKLINSLANSIVFVLALAFFIFILTVLTYNSSIEEETAKLHIDLNDYVRENKDNEVHSVSYKVDIIDARKNKPYIKISNFRVYLYSACIVEVSERNKIKIVINGWQHRDIHVEHVTCCLHLSNGTRRSSSGYQIPTLQPILNSTLIPKQYECYIYSKGVNIVGVSLAINTPRCPNDQDSYITPYEILQDVNNNIGVCSKFVYGKIDAEWLIEWFEVHRMFGVDKVLINTYELNSAAERVLDYYQSIGVAEITKEFKEPELDTLPRKVGQKIPQAWMDESVILKDCLARLSHYKYVAVVDVDEYVIPSFGSLRGVWTRYLDQVFSSKIAGITFRTKYHGLTWGPTNVSSQLYITRYLNDTGAILDREKNIHMPSRVVPESVTTHSYLPINGYQRFFAYPDDAVIHHFRQCRPEWMQPMSEQTTYIKHLTQPGDKPVCFNLKRSPCSPIAEVGKEVLHDVIKIRTKLNISI